MNCNCEKKYIQIIKKNNYALKHSKCLSNGKCNMYINKSSNNQHNSSNNLIIPILYPII